jgi:antitoxin component of MazEF toxin-antitoxin module
VEPKTKEEGSLQIQRLSRVPNLSQLVVRITQENRHGEISTGKSLGKESVEW